MTSSAVGQLRSDTGGTPAGGRAGAVRMVGGVVVALASGTMLFFSWTKFGGLWWLTSVALVPMYIAQYRILPRRWSGLAVGLAYGGYVLAGFLHMSSLIPAVWCVAAAAVLGVCAWGLGSFLRPFSERTGYRWFLVQLPLAWVFLDEFVWNNKVFGSYSWIAYRLGEAPILVQPVSILSAPALSFLIILWNAFLALAIMRLMDRRWPHLAEAPIPRRTFGWSSAIAVGVVAAWIVSSVVIYNQVTAAMGPTVRVAAVQPGVGNATPGTLIVVDPDPGRSMQQRRRDQAAQLSDMTTEAARRGAELVVWPEEVLDYDPRITGPKWIPQLLRRTGVYLVMGFTADVRDFSSPNVALMWNPEGEAVGVYEKVHPVVIEGESFTPGTTFTTVTTGVGPVGMIICFDIDFPNSSPRLVTLTGSQIIAAPSIDFASIAPLRTDSTVFRSIENRVGLVKADIAWDSAIVAPNGQVLESTMLTDDSGGSALLVQDLPRGPRDAPFTQLGGAWFAVLVAFFTAWMLVAMIRSKKPGGSHPADVRG